MSGAIGRQVDYNVIGYDEWKTRALSAEAKVIEQADAVGRLTSALGEMVFAYRNKDAEFPHDFELEALELAKAELSKQEPV